MSENKLLLTISFLVSNRIDTIGRLMESLRPLAEGIPSEIIAVDTGSYDGSIEVVEKYADKIVKFDWCGDFSAARNAGLECAEGEWFMYIDDDEYFEDVSGILDFFKSGTYKKYGMAAYEIHNYLGADMAEYSVSFRDGLFRIDNSVKFSGIVHEKVINTKGEKFTLPSFAHHFGYAYKSDEERKAHYTRNITLLKKAVEISPKDVRLMSHLIQEYRANNELEECRKAGEYVLNNLPVKENVNAYGWIVYTMALSAYLSKKDGALKEAGGLLDKYGDIPSIYKAAANFILLKASCENNSAETECAYCRKTIDCIKEFEADEKAGLEYKYMEINGSWVYGRLSVLCEIGVKACCKTGDFLLLGDVLEIAYSPKNLNREDFIDFMKSFLKNNAKYRNVIISKTAALRYDDDLEVLVCRALEKEEFGPALVQPFYDKAAVISVKKNMYNSALLKLAGRNRLNQEVILQEGTREGWDIWIVSSFKELTENELLGLKEGLAGTQYTKNALKKEGFEVTLERYIFIRAMFGTDRECAEMLEEYCACGLHYFRNYYHPNLFAEEDWVNLPSECRFLLWIEKAVEARRGGDTKECINILRKAVNIYPEMGKAVSCYLEDIQNEMNRPQTAADEFNKLGEKVKAEAEKFIAVGQKQAALSILEQLEKLIPGDGGVLRLKEKAEKL